MSVSDNFNYSIPTLNRSNTMYLSVINSSDASMKPFKKISTQRDWSTNLYNLDIESSMPRSFGIFNNKVDFINKIDDIEKASPKPLYDKPIIKPEYNLTNKDIEGSSPNVKEFSTVRCTNPLQPKYQLPKCEEYPPEFPRFIRDQISIKDIEGASPHKCSRWKTRETFPLDNGIEGSKTKEHYVRQSVGNTKYHFIDYSDLTVDIFKTKRNTNPLYPLYSFKRETGTPYQYGHIEKSKPCTYYPYYYQPALGLKIDDIKDTNPGSKNFISKFNGKNFQLNIADIEKSFSGSLKKGIVTKRCTNPLVPNYQYLGEKELQGAKFGEYSINNNMSKNRAHSFIGNKNKTKTKIISQNEMNLNTKVEEAKNQPNINDNNHKKCVSNGNEEFLSNKEQKMLGINDIPDNVNNNNYTSKYPYQAESKERNLENNKIMNKTATSPFYNNYNKPEENQVLYNTSDKQYGTQNLLGGNSNYNSNRSTSSRYKNKMGKTCYNSFRNFNNSPYENLDTFMTKHNLKYIEAPKVEKLRPPFAIESPPEQEDLEQSKKGKSTIAKKKTYNDKK